MNKTIVIGMGCFWGVQKAADSIPGVKETTVGYMGGTTPNPTYMEVCSNLTGHVEVVEVVYEDDPKVLADLLKFFWEQHDPTQGNRQGNDIGSQYRSVIYSADVEQLEAAKASAEKAQQALTAAGFGPITTEISLMSEAGQFWPAEEYHQKYLEKNPNGYCPVHATGIKCGWTADAQ
ncbi:peptide-methionine (S)-S-oxide reductase MsrA [Boudabousia marimammalium]|uniref:Peptide methionine sulfoxide reductase MsrA n=1 Tax=Boudabousia marimammalium TaxID=156892 RepID=A0A1Q5PRS6_9ACTO|nr:peptide-methionine (S)-S-oxide reductase MsrA [Boudabousia marimammalium]OKL50266.1 peptide-methionine (S)-S-oxide reductase [Boudabousia marimammalium]